MVASFWCCLPSGQALMVEVGWGMFCFIMGIVFVCVLDPWNDNDRI